MTSVSVVAAVESDLKEIGSRDSALETCGLAATALALAHDLDDRSNSATSRSMCAKALVDTLDRLWELAPAKDEGSKLDDLSARRAARRAGSGAA